jgi:hypothetical protein
MVEIQYFSSNKIEADVLDYSAVVVNILDNKGKRLSIKIRIFDVKNGRNICMYDPSKKIIEYTNDMIKTAIPICWTWIAAMLILN